ncbi:MAG: nitroreductase family protein [Bacteroidales bacterium]|nr:nitroreductase family protein [Candidatus Physcousia equi]
MNCKKIKNALFERLPLSLRFLIETLRYWRSLCRYNASKRTDSDQRKMQYTLQRETHVIEKGMSMRTTRRGFGQAKVLALMGRLQTYVEKYADKPFVVYPLSTIKEYIVFQQKDGVAIPQIETRFDELCKQVGVQPSDLHLPAGIRMEQCDKLQQAAKGDFRSLLYSRHSIRYFADRLPSHQKIAEALELASRTPSACNRQAWHTHVYFGEDSHRLLQMQSGCNGFHDDIHCSIVVTADMKGFLGHEPFQCYVDGGLYAQNLINALHYVGLGSIPLSCGFMSNKLNEMKKCFHIPDSEVMIVIIGVGEMLPEMKIAISTRKDFTTTNVFHT